MVGNSFLKLIIWPIIFFTAVSLSALTPVETHGKLTTDGGYLLDQSGKIVQLRGMSFYWSTESWPGYKYYTAATVDALVDSWKCTVVRAAYDRNNSNNSGWDGVKVVIDEAIKKGIYVIIDWHSHTAEQQESTAIEFFKTQAQTYKNTPNVIFEPYNEPIKAGGASDGSSAEAKKTWTAIKPYLKNVTKAIRGQGADNLVILGTPYYSQYVDVAAVDQVLDDSGNVFKNVAYSFHFYAASHGSQAYYVKNDPTGAGGLEGGFLANAIGKIPIFITEWGTTHSDGGESGAHTYVDLTNTNWWFDKYINGAYHISWCNWSVSDFQTSSAFSGSISTPSASGTVVKGLLTTPTTDSYSTGADTGFAGPSLKTVFTMPGTQPTTNFNRYFGANVKSGSIAYLKRDLIDGRTAKNTIITVPAGVASEWISYNIKSESATKKIFIRYFAPDGSGSIEVYLDDIKISQIAIPKNSSWAYAIASAAVPAGNHVLKLKFTKASYLGYSIEWFELSNQDIPTSAKMFDQHTKTVSNVNVFVLKNSIEVMLPGSHKFVSYSLTGVDGRIVKKGAILSSTSLLKFNDLPNGKWLLKLDASDGSKLCKTIVNGR